MVPSDEFYCVFILFRWSVKCNIVICFVIFLRVPGTGGSRECPLFSLSVCMIPGTNPSLLTFICNSTISPDGAFWVICRSGQSTENCAHSQLWLYFSLSLFPLNSLTAAAEVKKGLLWLTFKAPWQESQGIWSLRQLPKSPSTVSKVRARNAFRLLCSHSLHTGRRTPAREWPHPQAYKRLVSQVIAKFC